VLTEATPESPAASIEVREPASGQDYVSVVALIGEHDLATRDQLAEVLAPILGPVLVDLSACSFIDSTIISVLIGTHQSLAQVGHGVELRVPPAGYVRRTLTVSGVEAILPLHQA
jgi:anti-sigma B factor antagonist